MAKRLHNYLRTHRKRRDFTQAEVAFLLGCRHKTKVGDYEHRGRRPVLETAPLGYLIPPAANWKPPTLAMMVPCRLWPLPGMTHLSAVAGAIKKFTSGTPKKEKEPTKSAQPKERF